ncbi:hypothetical protein [uncultured Algimonas sp.]|uniref:hypothetical protein n=1 Tax=uncultured Algimonas sp. TaxID=1547920 RepID=UPI00260BFD82|nr:hypothetical protein [uncultured Algimonas sp.]
MSVPEQAVCLIAIPLFAGALALWFWPDRRATSSFIGSALGVIVLTQFLGGMLYGSFFIEWHGEGFAYFIEGIVLWGFAGALMGPVLTLGVPHLLALWAALLFRDPAPWTWE